MNTAQFPPSPIGESIPMQLSELARLRTFAKGEYPYRPTDRMECIFIIKRGLVKIGGYGPEGDESIYDIVYPGEFCGNLKYLGGGSFQEFAKAVTEVEAIAYNLSTFKRNFRESGKVHDWFIRLMVQRWARSEARLFRIASMKSRERLQSLLEELAIHDQQVRNLLTQEDLANLTGLTRQTIAKLLPTIR